MLARSDGAAAAGAAPVFSVGVDVGGADTLDFFHSTALRKSLALLDLAEVAWTRVKPVLIFETLFQSELGADRRSRRRCFAAAPFPL